MPPPKRVDRAVKIDAELVRLAGIVAAYRNQNMNDYLSEVLGPIVARDLAEEQAKNAAPAAPRPRKGGR